MKNILCICTIVYLCVIGVNAQSPYVFPSGPSFGNNLSSFGYPGSSTMMDCFTRTQSMEQYYNNLGYQTQIGYQTTASNADHIYLFVKDPSTVGWAAVDSYFGYITPPSSYYTPTSIFPTWASYDASRTRTQV